ncbi:MAG TPA: ribosome-associated translation inhibitor RaiA [Cytophagales bacterium]|nr:ribosome-associated translation inhibitor RaiA [Cytophagales bacterium]
MKLQIHSIHFDADVKLLDYIEKKTNKLHTYFERITDGEIFLKLDKGEALDNKIVEIKLNVPGHEVFVKEKSRTFEAATDIGVEALEKQLKRIKEKALSLR